MFRFVQSSRSLLRPALARKFAQQTITITKKNNFSTSSSSSGNKTNPFLHADTGPLSTRIHHNLTIAQAVVFPLFFFAPDDGALSKTLGVILATSFSTHTWIALNYIAADYVPKIFWPSKTALPKARVGIFGIAALMFIGLNKITFFSPGGIKAVLLAPWNPPPRKNKNDPEKLEF